MLWSDITFWSSLVTLWANGFKSLRSCSLLMAMFTKESADRILRMIHKRFTVEQFTQLKRIYEEMENEKGGYEDRSIGWWSDWDNQCSQEKVWSWKDSRRSVTLNMNHPFKRKKKEPEMAPPPSPLFTWTDEDQAYVNKMLMKDARKNLRKKIEPFPKRSLNLPNIPFQNWTRWLQNLRSRQETRRVQSTR